MATTIASNRSARDAVLGRVREALGVSGDRGAALAQAQAYVGAHAQGPRPQVDADLTARFLTRATDMASTVDRVATRSEIPAAVARYLETLQPRMEVGPGGTYAAVCWPELADLEWGAAGIAIEARPALGSDRLGITGCFCAIAETGTLVITTGAQTPTATSLLPDTHIAVVDAARIVPAMEEAFALVRSAEGAMPRAMNMISGPSRTGDIEQTIVLGAHGPYRMHVIVVG